MAEETGFFRFDTNIDAVVGDIEGGLRRLNSTMSRPLRLNQTDLGINTQELQQGMGRIGNVLEQGRQRIRDLFSQRSGGLIDASTFNREIRGVISGTVGSIPRMLAEEMARVPTSVATTTPVKAIAKELAADFTRTLEHELDQGLAASGGKVRSVSRFKDILDSYGPRIEAEPLAAKGISPYAALTNRVRAEQLIRENLQYIPTARSKAESAGLGPLVDRIIDREGRVYEDESGHARFDPSDANQRLKDLIATQKEGEQVAKRVFTAEEKEAEAHRQNALALLAEAEAWDRLGKTRARDPQTGQVYRRSPAGLVEDNHPDAARDFEDDHREKLLREEQQVARENVAIQARADAEKKALLAEQRRADREAEASKKRTLAEEQKYVRENLAIMGRANAEKIAAAKEALRLDKLAAREQLHNSGFTGGFVNRFQRGEQSFSTGLGAQVGSAVGFSLAYGAIFAVQHALRDTMSEFLDYQDSMTDLQVATRNSDVVTSEWVNSLSELSRVSGDNVGAALDAAARGVRAFTTAQSSANEVTDAGTQTAKTATRLALIANKPLPDATGDIIATGSAFGLRPDQLEQVVDAVANAKRNVGGDAAQISQGLSLIALSAQEAGFNLNEAAAVIGLVQARTDQSGQAIATRLTRIFQIVQGSTGRTLARQLGVDSDSSVKDRLESFAKIYSNEDTSEATRNRIASALGGTANLRELLPLLKENKALQAAYAQALANSGQGTDEYNRKTQNLVGTLKKIQGDISKLQVNLANSGLFDFVGIGLRGLEPALYGLTQLLDIYNEMPRPLRTALGLTLDLVLATKALGVLTATGLSIKGLAHTAGLTPAAAGAAQQAEERAVRQREIAVITYMTQQRLLAEGRFNEAIALMNARRIAVETEAQVAGAATGGIRGGAAVAGRFLANPYVLGTAAVLGALALYGVAKQQEQQKEVVLEVSRNSLSSFDFLDTSVAGLRTAAQDQNAAAGEIRKSPVPGGFEDDRTDLANAAASRSQALLYLAERTAAEERLSAKMQKTTLFGTGAIETIDQIATGLQTIAENGGTGLDQYNALVKALRTPPPEEGTQYFTRQGLNNAIITTLMATARDSIPEGVKAFPNGEDPNPVDTSTIRTKGFNQQAHRRYNEVNNTDLVLAQLGLVGDENTPGQYTVNPQTAQVIDDALNKAQEKLGINPAKGLTNQQMSRLLKVAMNQIDMGKLGDDAQKVVDEWYKNSQTALERFGKKPIETGTPLDLLNGKGPLSNANIEDLLTPRTNDPEGKPDYAALPAIFDAAIGAIPESDDGSQLEAVQKSQANVYRELARRNRASGEEYGALLLLADNAQHAYLETAVANLDDLRQAAESRATTNKQLRAIRLSFAKKEFDKAGSDLSVLEPLMESLDQRTVSQVIAYVKTARDVARAALQHARAIVRAAQAAFGESALLGGGAAAFFGITGASTDQLDALGNAQDGFRKRNKQYQALLDALKGSAISDKVAKLPDPGGKSPEDLAAERRAAAEERLNNAIDALQLTGDFTDPVEQARDALRAARMRYRFEKTPGGLAEIHTSEAALEKAKWDQKLSDMQTAEQLGRISYATYTRYLQNESDRMHKMNHKTRQQIDYMNQIDLALKETTASMEGQFNLGDIDTKGFVYAVRRMMNDGGGAAGNGGWNGWKDHYPGGMVNNNQSVVIHGADTHKIREVLREFLGGVPIHTTSSRKVA